MGWLWDTPTEEQLLRRSNFPGKKLGWEIQEKTYTEVPSVSVENNALQLWKCNNFDGVLTCQKSRCWTVQEVGKSEGSNGDLSTGKKKTLGICPNDSSRWKHPRINDFTEIYDQVSLSKNQKCPNLSRCSGAGYENTYLGPFKECWILGGCLLSHIFQYVPIYQKKKHKLGLSSFRLPICSCSTAWKQCCQINFLTKLGLV